MDYRQLTETAREALGQALRAPLGPAPTSDELTALCAVRTLLYERIDQTLAVLTGARPDGGDLIGALSAPERLAAGRLREISGGAALAGRRLRQQPIPASDSTVVIGVRSAAHALADMRVLLAGHLRADSGLTATGRDVAGGSDGRAVLADTVTYLAAATDLDARIAALPAADVTPQVRQVLDHARHVDQSTAGRVWDLAWALHAEPVVQRIPPTGVLADLRAVPSLNRVPVTGPQQLASAVEQVAHWMREHPGQMSVGEHTDIVDVAGDLVLLAGHVAPHLPGGPDPDVTAAAVRATTAWHQTAVEFQQLRPVDPLRYAPPLLDNVSGFVQGVLRSGEPPAVAGARIAYQGREWRDAMAGVLVSVGQIAEVLQQELGRQVLPETPTAGTVQVRTGDEQGRQWRLAEIPDITGARDALFDAGQEVQALRSAVEAGGQRTVRPTGGSPAERVRQGSDPEHLPRRRRPGLPQGAGAGPGSRGRPVAGP